MQCRQRAACHSTLSSTLRLRSGRLASFPRRATPPTRLGSDTGTTARAAHCRRRGSDGHDDTTPATRRVISLEGWRMRSRRSRRRAQTGGAVRGQRPHPRTGDFERLTRRPPGSCHPQENTAIARRPAARAGAQRPAALVRRHLELCDMAGAAQGRRAPEGSRGARLRSQPVDDRLRWTRRSLAAPHLSTAAQRRAAAERSERSERPSGARRPCAAPAHQTNALRSDALTQPPALPADVLGRRAPPLATPGAPGRPCTSHIPTSHRRYRERSPRPRRASVCRE